MAHSVPLNIAPTLAKLRPDAREERYMSRRPCFSCWRRGRSDIGIAEAPPVGERVRAGEDEEREAVGAAERVVGGRGAFAYASVLVDDLAAGGGGVAAGSGGWPIGVS
jgi:hypothetical protein